MSRASVHAVIILMGAGMSAQPIYAAPVDAGLTANEAGIKLVRGQHRAAVELFTDALVNPKISAEQRANLYNDRGVAYWRIFKYRKSITDFNASIKLFPENPATYNNRGNVLMSIGELDEAVRDFNRAILLAPGYAAAFNNRANAKTKLGKHEDAIKDYTRAIKLIPTNPVAVAGRGNAHLALARTFTALRDFSRALGLNARFGAGYGARARAYLELERYGEAIEDLTRAIAFDPKNYESYLIRGRAYLSGANYASAINDFTKTIDLRPNGSTAYADRGLAYAKIQDFDPALDDLGRAIELNQKDVSAYARRAWTYLAMDAAELGLRDVERALKINPQSAEAYRVRGEIYERLGRPEEAISDFQHAVDLDPEENIAWNALEQLAGIQKPGPREITKSGYNEWRVFADGKHYFATNRHLANIKVPLESLNETAPRIVNWEIKQYPFRGIGVLRYEAGTIAADQEDSEKARAALLAFDPKAAKKSKPSNRIKVAYAAIVDLNSAKVVGIEPVRYGNKLTAWNWREDGRLNVVGRDGVSSELQLRQVAVANNRRNPYGSNGGNTSVWGPNGQTVYGGPDAFRQRKIVKKRRRKKKKNFFQLLFGN